MGQDLITITIEICILAYITMFLIAIWIFCYDYYEDNITQFDVIILSIFWPITVPYKLIKTLIKAIKKI